MLTGTTNPGQYLSLPPTRQDLTQGQMTRRLDYSGGCGGGGWT